MFTFYKRLKVVAFCLLSIVLFACKDSGKDEEVVIKIGSAEISRHTYERELEKIQSQGGGKVNQKVIDEWEKRFMDDCYFISDAQRLCYDTAKSISDQMESMANLMMVQKYGYLWKKTISPIVDEFKKVTNEKVKKRGKLFYFEYIVSTDIDSLKGLMDYTLSMKSNDEFDRLKKMAGTYKCLHSGYFSMQWPFVLFGKYRDEILSMKEKQFSSPLFIDKSVYFLYLDRIEQIEVDEKDKATLERDLQLVIEDELETAKDKEMITSGKPELNEMNIDKIVQFISKGGDIKDFNENLFLIKYQLDQKEINVDYRTFLRHLNRSIYTPKIVNKKVLVSELNQLFYNDYLLHEAEGLGLFQTSEYKMDKKFYEYKLALSNYFNGEFIDKIKIDSTEALNYYNNNKSNYILAKCYCVDLWYFGDKVSAEKRIASAMSTSKSKRDGGNGIAALPGLSYQKLDTLIDVNSTEFPVEMMGKIEKMADEVYLSNPVFLRGKYVVVFKKKTLNNHLLEFDKVEKTVHQQILNDKFNTMRGERLKKLKGEYPIEINKTGIQI